MTLFDGSGSCVTVLPRDPVTPPQSRPRIRRIFGADAEAAVAIFMAHSRLASPALHPVLARLIAEGTAFCAVIEEFNHRSLAWTPASYMFYCFLSPEADAAFTAAPDPFLTVTLLQEAGRLRSATRLSLLGEREIALANASSGVDVFVLKWVNITPHDFAMESDRGRACLAAGYRACEFALRGYNLRSVRIQSSHRTARVFLGAGFRIQHDHGLVQLPDDTQFCHRVSFAYRRSDYEKLPEGTCVSRLFHYFRPQLNLTSAEKEIIELALDGKTNSQIAQRLNTSLSAVKMRWDRIYQRFERQVPHVLEGLSDSTDRRGTERRRTILRYVDDNPAEVRPCLRAGATP